MIVSNISTPLLGLVDTAVMGHLDAAYYLGAVALGGLIFSFIYWGFGFLRMGTTGLVARAFGEKNEGEIKAVLSRALLLSQLIAWTLIGLKLPLSSLGFVLLDGGEAVESQAAMYVDIRFWSAPATLALYVLSGWFLGMQNVKAPLAIVLLTNLSNIVLDIYLVSVLHWGVAGVAWATVWSEYLGLILGMFLLHKRLRSLRGRLYGLADISRIKAMLAINGHLFIRTWCLIFAFAFFTAQGARLGEVVLAANAVLMNFQTFMAYALDGFAHAAEALVGRAVGEKNPELLRYSVKTAGGWSLGVACGFAVFYLFFGEFVIDRLTGLDAVRETADMYLPWLVAMPLVSFLCYLFDGVFIGAMLNRQMRNAMLFALFIGYLPTWYLCRDWGNQGLWLAMTVFMLGRSLSMSWIYARAQIFA